MYQCCISSTRVDDAGRPSAAYGVLVLRDERVRESEEQSDTNTDHGYRVEQRDDEEHLRLQHRRQLRLTCGTFQEAATEEAHADTDAQCAKADQKRYGQCGKPNYSFHQFLQLRIRSK